MFESGNPLPRNEPTRPTSSLSEISHLFLSGVRERTEGGARPQRRPPGQHVQRPNTSIDLTPEEFAGVFDREDATRLSAELDDLPAASGEAGDLHSAPSESRPSTHAEPHAPITAVLAGHFGARQLERVRDYARHLAAANKRIGLIEVDAAEFRLWCFDGHAHTHIEHPAAHARELAPFEGRHVREALAEMGWDVEQWLLALPTPRVAEAKALLHTLPNWVLLGTADHDGVVSAYRTMKGLFEDVQRDAGREKPRVVLSVLDSDEGTADRIYRKLASVCEEFLAWHIEAELAPPARHDASVAEHLVMACRTSRDKFAAGPAAHWQVLTDFIAGASARAVGARQTIRENGATQRHHAVKPRHAEAAGKPARSVEEKMQMNPLSSPSGDVVDSVVSAEESRHFIEPLPEATSAQPAMVFPPAGGDDVIDLLGQETTESAIIASVLRHAPQMVQLVECPIVPPMRATAKLAVTREHRLSLIAVARQGLGDLRSIGQAYRWLVENRALIAMAMPQMAIDAHAMPHLSVLIDQSDTTAELLQPLFSAAHVTVRTYRKLRWGGKTGLLLEAA